MEELRDLILIRHSGKLPTDEPIVLVKSSIDLTIRGDATPPPILTLSRPPEQDGAMFRLHDGKVAVRSIGKKCVSPYSYSRSPPRSVSSHRLTHPNRRPSTSCARWIPTSTRRRPASALVAA